MKRVYLDWAASAPVHADAARAFKRAERTYGNPSSPHTEGRAARALLEDARVRIARLASVKADAVLFTAGATEANALAILGQVRAYTSTEVHVLYLPSAHASTQGAVRMLQDEGIAIEPITLVDGGIDRRVLKQQIRSETKLIAIEAVCGETGTRFDTGDVRRVIDEVRKEAGTVVRLHVDASQLPFAESFELTRLGADTLSLDAQKVGGVRGIGVLIAPRSISLTPLLQGGGQERGIRPGTESPALAEAFATALESADGGRAAFTQRASKMREQFIHALQREIPDLIVNGGTETVPHIVNVSLIGRDTDYLAALLDEAGFAIATRSACATDAEGSVAVLAMTGDGARAAATLRISWGPETRDNDLMQLVPILARAIRFLDTNAL